MIRHFEAVPLIGNGDVIASAHAVASEAFGFEHPLEEDGLKAVMPTANFGVHPALGRRRHGIAAAKRRQVAQRAGVKLAQGQAPPSSLDAS